MSPPARPPGPWPRAPGPPRPCRLTGPLCPRCVPSARPCPGATRATRAPTFCSTCSTGTSSPTTPSWWVPSPPPPPVLVAGRSTWPLEARGLWGCADQAHSGPLSCGSLTAGPASSPHAGPPLGEAPLQGHHLPSSAPGPRHTDPSTGDRPFPRARATGTFVAGKNSGSSSPSPTCGPHLQTLLQALPSCAPPALLCSSPASLQPPGTRPCRLDPSAPSACAWSRWVDATGIPGLSAHLKPRS